MFWEFGLKPRRRKSKNYTVFDSSIESGPPFRFIMNEDYYGDDVAK